MYKGVQCVFYLKKIIILLSEYVEPCFYYFLRNTGFQMLQIYEVIFFYILFYQLYIIKCMIFIVYMPDWSFFKLV